MRSSPPSNFMVTANGGTSREGRPVTHFESGVVDPIYLPFTEDELKIHFAPIAHERRLDPDRHLTYYRESTKRTDRQMEKDERFWVMAALVGLFSSEDPVNAFATALRKCLSEAPPFSGFATWEETLGDVADLQLYFEVNLPSPKQYGATRVGRLDELMLPVPHLRAAAERARAGLEGTTKVDAVLIAPETGCAVLFEAKVLADTSCSIRFDPIRNQIARNIDVMLEENAHLAYPLNRRVPERTCFVLLTPELFCREPESRLYGWLYQAYKNRESDVLQRHLRHRNAADLANVPERLGWLTYEECNRIVPNTCRWLMTADVTPIEPGAKLE
jgi:hypothetical protein